MPLEINQMTDEQLEAELDRQCRIHDRLIDNAPMGDERIEIANNKCRALMREQDRRRDAPRN